MSSASICIGADHAGFFYKEQIKKMLTELGYAIKDLGTHTQDSVDYPDYAHAVAKAVAEQAAHYGILICGSGNGVCITANKHHGIRAALCWTVDIARLARQHNNANILCLPARFISLEEAQTIVLAFLQASFEGGRHERRIEKIDL